MRWLLLPLFDDTGYLFVYCGWPGDPIIAFLVCGKQVELCYSGKRRVTGEVIMAAKIVSFVSFVAVVALVAVVTVASLVTASCLLDG